MKRRSSSLFSAPLRHHPIHRRFTTAMIGGKLPSSALPAIPAKEWCGCCFRILMLN